MWFFNNQEFTEKDVDKFEGFVYLIINKKTGQKYIGRKYFWSIRKVKGKTKRQRTPSDWMSYYGSSDEVKEAVKELGSDNFERHILSLHKTRGDCNRTEQEMQWKLNVLYDDMWYNRTIGNHREVKQSIVETRKVSKLFLELGGIGHDSRGSLC